MVTAKVITENQNIACFDGSTREDFSGDGYFEFSAYGYSNLAATPTAIETFPYLHLYAFAFHSEEYLSAYCSYFSPLTLPLVNYDFCFAVSWFAVRAL